MIQAVDEAVEKAVESESGPNALSLSRTEPSFRPTFLNEETDDSVAPKRKAPSTRDQFISDAQNEGLLDGAKATRLGFDDVVTRMKLSFANLVAEDWNSVLSEMIHTLDEMDRKMSDNVALRRNVQAWRRLLCSWRVSLLEYSTRLQQAINLLRRTLGLDYAALPTTMEELGLHLRNDQSLQDLQSTLDVGLSSKLGETLALYEALHVGLVKVESRVNLSFQVLMSSMSIIESEKAIVQGAAITKLTELAFFFIPLSFAAAFFSMQVQV